MNSLFFSLAVFLVIFSTVLLIAASYSKQKGTRKVMVVVSLVLMVFPFLYLLLGVYDLLLNS